MYSHIIKKAAIVGIVLASIAYSCESKPCCENAEQAIIKDMKSLDGCSFNIELQNGEMLQVVNLDDFDINLKDGTPISISYHDADESTGICMVGKSVVASCICKE